MTASSVVLDFLRLLEEKRADEAVTMLAEDVEWRNTGYPTLRGPRAAQALQAMERRGVTFSVDMHHIAATGDVVLTDRTDHLGMGRWNASFWVCGTFEIRDGKIAVWHDHFSTSNVLVGSVKGLLAMLRGPDAP